MNWYKKSQNKKECTGWLAIRLDKKNAKTIQEWGNKHIPENSLFKEDGHGREKDTHITICYGICTDNLSIIKEALGKEKPIKIVLKKIGFFKPDDKYDAVIIKVESKDLEELNKKINYILNVETTYSEYKPHCTIAYVKNGEAMKYAGDTYFNNTEIILNKIVFANNKNEEIEIILK